MSIFDNYNSSNEKDLSRSLWEQQRKHLDKIHEREDRERLKEEIIAEVMKRIQVEYKTNATQAAKELQDAINSVFQGH